ncbi:secretory-abundant heat soluble protein 1-like [Paramacrobiotus metropolitanus]|uniref:secretory-abundant heat soluble protein 1-like n=1 Tax=Paramacrobiotus metropolitanus TaxID=2943436 RepID=UPI002445AF80|nr:secretory-abundant heat soluble protein 1-like [Paramacrobiotus metropolitanus]
MAFMRIICLGTLAIAAIEGAGLDAFLGKYESTDRRENTQAFAAALKQDDIHAKIINEFSASGDEYHHKFSVPSKNYVQDLPFKLGEERQAAFNGTNYKYKYTLEGDSLKANFDLPDRQVDQMFTFSGNEMVKTYKVGDVTAKVWFTKV